VKLGLGDMTNSVGRVGEGGETTQRRRIGNVGETYKSRGATHAGYVKIQLHCDTHLHVQGCDEVLRHPDARAPLQQAHQGAAEKVRVGHTSRTVVRPERAAGLHLGWEVWGRDRVQAAP
jgi:hypothetical protein